MKYQLPKYILNSNINSPEMMFPWDETAVTKNFNYTYAKSIINKVSSVSLRGRITLIIGIYEWILGRYWHLSSREEPIYIAEAAWCANINKRYISYYEMETKYPPNDFVGPIDGVLWCAFNELIPILNVSDNITKIDPPSFYEYDTNAWYNCLLFIIPLAELILPHDKLPLFKSWLDGVIDRLIKYYTMPEEDPFANLFGHKDEKGWLGDYVAREVLDLDFPYHPKDAVKLCDQFLQQVDYHNNPLLVPPEQLTNIIKHPYRLLE